MLKVTKSKFSALALAALMSAGLAGSAAAATIGVAVIANNSDTTVAGQPSPNLAETAALLGAAAGIGAVATDIIGYYIPLDGSDCTFGTAGCGTTADTGTGGALMTMWIKYKAVAAGNSFLNLFFEDLDLDGANDPAGFLEQVAVYNTSESLVATFTDITDPDTSGTASTQQIASVALGNLAAGDYWAKLVFSASSPGGTNTPEFLIAAIDSQSAIPPVPLPAAGWMLLAALGGLGAASRRRKAA